MINWPIVGDLVYTPYSVRPSTVQKVDERLGNAVAVWIYVAGEGRVRVLMDLVAPAPIGGSNPA